MFVHFENVEDRILLHHFEQAIHFLEKHKDVQIDKEGFENLKQELVERRVITFH